MVLEIMISGLCAFARQSCTVGDAKAMHILLMNGHTTHNPRLVVEQRFVRPPAKDDDVDVKKAQAPDEAVEVGGIQFLVWNLTGYRIEFANPPKIGIWEGRRDYAKKVPDYGAHPAKNEPAEFSWVPEIYKACGVDPKKAKVKDEALKQDTLPSYVGARFQELTVVPNASNPTNWLEAAFVYDQATGAGQDISKYKFPSPSTYEQVLAERARLTAEFPDDQDVTLRLVPYKGGLTRVIRLQKVPKVSVIPVTVSNLSNDFETFDPKAPLDHFTAFYDLIDDPNVAKDCKPPIFSGAGENLQPVKCTICSICGGS